MQVKARKADWQLHLDERLNFEVKVKVKLKMKRESENKKGRLAAAVG